MKITNKITAAALVIAAALLVCSCGNNRKNDPVTHQAGVTEESSEYITTENKDDPESNTSALPDETKREETSEPEGRTTRDEISEEETVSKDRSENEHEETEGMTEEKNTEPVTSSVQEGQTEGDTRAYIEDQDESSIRKARDEGGGYVKLGNYEGNVYPSRREQFSSYDTGLVSENGITIVSELPAMSASDSPNAWYGECPHNGFIIDSYTNERGEMIEVYRCGLCGYRWILNFTAGTEEILGY